MTFSECSKGRNALTLIELFILVAVLSILAVLFLPSTVHDHMPRNLWTCGHNLKQIGLAFNTWALDNGGAYPMGISINEGGTSGLTSGSNAFMVFRVMSNELSTPKILFCPDDRKRHWATNFDSDLNGSRLSYFVGLDTEPTNSTMFLSGDRNLTNSSCATNGVLVLRSGDAAAWAQEVHGHRGNILLADGRVQFCSSAHLRACLQTAFTNRLAMP